jgi:predicted Zn-dependent protease
MIRMGYPQSRRRASSGAGIRLLLGAVVAIIAVISFLGSRQYNPVVGEEQYLSLTPEQEIVLGLQSVPEMMQEYGPEVRDAQIQHLVDSIGQQLVSRSVAATTPWEFDFHVLDNPETVNAFALPGGQVFITTALLNALETEDQLAGVLAHEIVHVLARHSAQQIAKSELTGGLVNAVAVGSGSASAAQTAAMIGQLVNMSYGREDEIQSDTFGICLMLSAGYPPEAMIDVMRILEQASGGSRQPEFMSTHPDPGNRVREIQNAIANADTLCASR